jgi:hypothetical protein
MMEEPANLDATLYKLFLKLDGHSAVFQIKQLYKTEEDSAIQNLRRAKNT